MNQHVSLVGKAGAGVDTVFAVAQFNPLPLPLGAIRVVVARVKARHIERAVVQQIAIGLGVLGVDLVAADELVDELAPFVVAHVNHCVAFIGLGQRRIFVFETA